MKMKNEFVLDYLRENCNGKANAKKRAEIAADLNITTRRLRAIIHDINSDIDAQAIVSGAGSVYLCSTFEEAEKAIKNAYRTAFSILSKARRMEGKAKLTEQYYLDFDLSTDEYLAVYNALGHVTHQDCVGRYADKITGEEQ